VGPIDWGSELGQALIEIWRVVQAAQRTTAQADAVSQLRLVLSNPGGET
jgi:hypothetical protein